MDPQQAPPQADLLIGQTIGNYLVTQKLGEGGMGAVYLAEHPGIGKKVALKVLHAEYSTNPEIAERFFNEAKAVNNIDHPNIVDIVDYGMLEASAGRDQLVYFIMEYLSGQTLSQLLRSEHQLAPERAFTIAMQVADALGAAHAKGIVHRDLKPDNIILQQRGRERDFVKLLDFGIAKLTNDAAVSHRTRTGIVMGTPAYMSPEQCEGKATVDLRTDIYALGIVLYEMLTGRVPYIGEGYGEILIQHLNPMQKPVPPSQYHMLDPAVEAVVLKALEKSPDLRFPTMGEFMRALADPQGYVDAHGGLGQFLQVPLTPSNAPIPSGVRPMSPYTPPPGTLQPRPGTYPGAAPAAAPSPTTLSAAAGEARPSGGKGKFLIAGALVVVAAAAGVAALTLGGGKESGSVVAQGSGTDLAQAGSGSSELAPPTSGRAAGAPLAAGSGSAAGEQGSGSATAQAGSADAGSAAAAGSAAEARTATIKLTTRPAGAAIFVNDVDTGKKTPEPFEVERAKRAVTITLKLDRHDDVVLRNFSVASDVTDDTPIALKRTPTTHTSGRTNKGRGTTTGRGTGRGSATGTSDDTGLIRPGDL